MNMFMIRNSSLVPSLRVSINPHVYNNLHAQMDLHLLQDNSRALSLGVKLISF